MLQPDFQPDPALPAPPVNLDPLLDPAELARAASEATEPALTAARVLNAYLPVFVVAFMATILLTPLVRRLALRTGVVDWPDAGRKNHRLPVPYLGGVAVFAGLMAGIAAGYLVRGYDATLSAVPYNVLFALTAIMLTGLADDLFHWNPNTKIAGQFVAAAFLAWDEQIGTQVAAGLLRPLEEPVASLLGLSDFAFSAVDVMPGAEVLTINVSYWLGAAIIGIAVLGACNAANLIDGLDGLLTGSAAIMSGALLSICVLLAVWRYGELDGARVVMCFALLGAALGFLPYNFKPASIFLGDAGSLLVGFSIVVIILMLGEKGHTHLVFAGLIVFGLPITDTSLAIIRRVLNRRPISEPDADHLHHLLKRTRLGTLGSVFVLYGINILFAAIAIALVFARARVVYAFVLVLGGFLIVSGIKAARRKQQMAEIAALEERSAARRASMDPPQTVPPRPVQSRPRVQPISEG